MVIFASPWHAGGNGESVVDRGTFTFLNMELKAASPADWVVSNLCVSIQILDNNQDGNHMSCTIPIANFSRLVSHFVFLHTS